MIYFFHVFYCIHWNTFNPQLKSIPSFYKGRKLNSSGTSQNLLFQKKGSYWLEEWSETFFSTNGSLLIFEFILLAVFSTSFLIDYLKSVSKYFLWKLVICLASKTLVSNNSLIWSLKWSITMSILSNVIQQS